MINPEWFEWSVCPECRGNRFVILYYDYYGYANEGMCPTCKGAGRVPKLKVEIKMKEKGPAELLRERYNEIAGSPGTPWDEMTNEDRNTWVHFNIIWETLVGVPLFASHEQRAHILRDKTSNWISVDDHLPTRRTGIIVWHAHDKFVTQFFFVPEDEAERPGILKRFGYTHWRYLPEGPV